MEEGLVPHREGAKRNDPTQVRSMQKRNWNVNGI